MERRVVITGMGAVTPLGLDLKTTWENLMKADEEGRFPLKAANSKWIVIL